MIERKENDPLIRIYDDIELAQAALNNAFRYVEKLRSSEQQVRRRRFAGECRVIRLDDRRMGGARV